jgi:hypothetical protein
MSFVLTLAFVFVFRLFNVDPETTARFSRINCQSRNRSPPGDVARSRSWPQLNSTGLL